VDKLLLVGIGGFLGSALRYGAGGWLARLRSGGDFPLETFVINVTGCLVIGFLAGLAETRGVFTPPVRAFLFVGVLGGYTTFSTLGYETFQLMRDGQLALGLGSAASQLVLGLGGVWLGDALSRWIA
jgi:fluoride exporter